MQVLIGIHIKGNDDQIEKGTKPGYYNNIPVSRKIEKAETAIEGSKMILLKCT